MNASAQAIECGVFPGMPESEYFALKAVSNSRLQPLLKSPAHCLWQMQNPSETTAAMLLGSAVDCLVFNPALFNERFAVADQCFALTQKKERCSKRGVHRGSPINLDGSSLGQFWHCGTHLQSGVLYDQVETLSEDQSSTAYNMAKAVINHPGASVLLSACDEFQLSLVWKEGNLLCKGRLDGLSTALKTIIDLKKCQDASPEGFARSIANYGYHRQGAMYSRGCSYHVIEIRNYIIIAVEEQEPHCVGLYNLMERIPSALGRIGDRLSPVEYGDYELTRLLALYEKCEASGEWPGYAEQPVPISLPGYVMAKMERE